MVNNQIYGKMNILRGIIATSAVMLLTACAGGKKVSDTASTSSAEPAVNSYSDTGVEAYSDTDMEAYSDTGVEAYSVSEDELLLIADLPRVDFDLDSPVGQITQGMTVTQSFVPATDRITGIWLYGATYKRDNTATINVRIEDVTDGITISSWNIDSAEMEDNSIIRLDVPDGGEDSGISLNGKECLIVIESPDGEPEASPTFWMTQTDIYPEGELSINGYEQYNDLWFQVVGMDYNISVTIAMVGDILLHTPVEEAARRDDGSYDFHGIFEQTSDMISEPDIALVNQEVIIGGEELGVSGYPAFNAPYAIGDALTDAGFDVILHATNHVLDKGAKGVNNCMSYWDSAHPDMTVLGIHDSAEDSDDIDIISVGGIDIAFLNYTYGTNGIPVPEGQSYLVDMLDESEVIRDLQMAEEQADFTVVCPHWGTEYRLEPDSNQLKWADIMASKGADLILGTHPHVIEPVEWVGETLVYYSLGNFVNWTSGTGAGTADRMVGGMALVTLTRDERGDVVISDYGVRALVTDLRDGRDGVTVYPLSAYTAEQADSNAIRRQDSSFCLDYCRTLCDRVWGDMWE